MLTLFGDSFHSPFRLARLLAQLVAAQPEAGVVSLRSQCIYFVDSQVPLTQAQHVLLKQLLSVEKVAQKMPSPLVGVCHRLVIPRLGTVSAWSSKATCIAQVCGLLPVKRIERGILYSIAVKDFQKLSAFAFCLHDCMTETVLLDLAGAAVLFEEPKPKPFAEIPVLEQGLNAIKQINTTLGLALSAPEMEYLLQNFQNLKRNPTDLELMMFAQANSEHCRHKIFNATWVREGKPEPRSLFGMIRHTYQSHPQGVLSAYKDNGAVLEGPKVHRWLLDPQTHIYREVFEPCHIVIKVETHNHPTAISPKEGAATGAGGEIRDEGAVGRGAKPKAGLVGFTVSHLRLPDFVQPWEVKKSVVSEAADSTQSLGLPPSITREGKATACGYGLANALDIMLEAPIGAAAFGNEFGRPTLCGYFRTYEQGRYGYHKPIMIAGGLGNVSAEAVTKGSIPDGAKVIVLGGPAMRIGLGGGAASSMASGSSDKALDFASVQRSNPQLQRCCQEVIDACWALGSANPIMAIHDVGAGGLANALSELVHDSDKGASFDLRAIPNAESGLSPMEIWCNEAQERYVLAVLPSQLTVFENIAVRERCPYAVVGEVNDSKKLRLWDAYFSNQPADLPFSVLFGDTPKLVLVKECLPSLQDQSIDGKDNVSSNEGMSSGERASLFRAAKQIEPRELRESRYEIIDLKEAAARVLQMPCVADKSFLITIGDRSVGGLVARDQMVGPWQLPVSDVAVTLSSFSGYTGEAMAMGERSPVAVTDPVASAYLAVGEAITNMAAAYIGDLGAVKLSANWMAAEANQALYAAVQAVAMDLCPALGICIPVGKDSLSMKTVWTEGNVEHCVRSPLSLIISAFAPVLDARKTLTPCLNPQEDTELWFIDIGQPDLNNPDQTLSGSVLEQVYSQWGHQSPKLFDPKRLKDFFAAIQTLNEQGVLLAYHDRSDGGLFVTLCEMAFASHRGLDIHLDPIFAQPANTHKIDWLAALFSESLGAVVQIRSQDQMCVQAILKTHGLLNASYPIGRFDTQDVIRFSCNGKVILSEQRVGWQRLWSETSYRMQCIRDNPDSALQAYDKLLDTQDTGLYAVLSFDPSQDMAAPYIQTGVRPKVAILREQGVNGHLEMAAAFAKAGFISVDVHMSDILEGRQSLRDFVGLAACGGFSYGDVLGSGQGWAKSILLHARAREEFADFFARPTTFTLGVCNGCQMLSHLKMLIPGSAHWPTFKVNQSEQFEARLVMVKVESSSSLFFRGMEGSALPVVVSHGEGRVTFSDGIGSATAMHQDAENLRPYSACLVTLRFIDNQGKPTEHYPDNPNGSPEGMTGFTTQDGRATILMPHPERVFRTVQCSWHPEDWPEESPWMQLFRNARLWVG